MEEQNLEQSKKSVLVIEDDERKKEIIVKLLNSDFLVHEADDKESTFKILNDNHIDMIVVDLHLNKMTGLELLEKIRDMGVNSPVVVMKNSCTTEDEKKFSELNIIGCITEPSDVRKIVNSIRKHVRLAKKSTKLYKLENKAQKVIDCFDNCEFLQKF